jgi:hypothetical protein
MKLSTVRIKQALEQLEPRTVVVPENHPKTTELNEIFGEHTFFLDDDGLEIIEPAAADDEDGLEENAGQVIRLAMWNDVARTTLAPHPAEATGNVVFFRSVAGDRVAQAGEDSFPASDATFHNGVTGEDDE